MKIMGVFIIMKIRTKKSLSGYKYLVVFDLASRITGVCLWSIAEHRPITTQVIKVNATCESKIKQLYVEIQAYFQQLQQQNIDLKDILVCKEAMPTQVHGGSSTIQTFIALAKSHAILDLFLENNNIDFYDDCGIYPASTHAYFRHIMDLNTQDKVTKEDVRQYVMSKYGLADISLDESDAVFLAETFVGAKWNRDLDEAIREVKRHKKELKAQHAIEQCNEEIEFLLSLKI